MFEKVFWNHIEMLEWNTFALHDANHPKLTLAEQGPDEQNAESCWTTAEIFNELNIHELMAFVERGHNKAHLAHLGLDDADESMPSTMLAQCKFKETYFFSNVTFQNCFSAIQSDTDVALARLACSVIHWCCSESDSSLPPSALIREWVVIKSV